MQKPEGDFVWDELDLFLDEKGPILAPTNAPVVGANEVPSSSSPNPHGAHGMPPQWNMMSHHPGVMVPHPPSGGFMYAGATTAANVATAMANNAMVTGSSFGDRDVSAASSTSRGRGRGRGKAAKRGRGKASASTPVGVTTPAGSLGGSLGGGGPAKGPSSAASSAGGSVGEGEDKEAKRRAAVAAASRATRAKRKRELEELKEKNVRLEKERETFLNTIADLQMKVQALRETGSIDLRMENDLLRAELMEHKNFISRFKRIADGMPTTSSAKKLMCKQGSDTAIAQVLGLLSTSMADPSWKVGYIRDHPEIDMRYQRLPHGFLAENAKRCSVRVDIPVIPCKDPELLANIIWKTWCDEDLNKRISKHFGAVSVSVREIETGVDEASEGDSSNSLKNRVKVYYYREETPRTDLDAVVSGRAMENDVVDTVLLLSAREKKISRSSFPQDERFHRFPPRSFTQDPKSYEPLTLEQQQGLHAQKNFDAIVLASTSTQHSLGLVPVKPGVHRIRSALLEGSVFRKVEGGVAMSSVFSYPSSIGDGQGKKKHDVLVTNDGYLNEIWTKVVSEVYAIMREHMPAYVFDSYRKLRDQGYDLPKDILNYL